MRSDDTVSFRKWSIFPAVLIDSQSESGYVHIDGRDGMFDNRDRDPISAKVGLDFALPAGQMHSHSQDVPELKIERQAYGPRRMSLFILCT
ncbi:MAG: hypothetical protein NVSMB62_10220 [Acidobacteriaceae bacterium]